jgi:hypothetical protein
MGKGNNDPFGDMIDSILNGQGANPAGRPSLPGDASRGKDNSGGGGNPLDDFFGEERRGGAAQPEPQTPQPETPGIGGGSIIDILGSILGGMGGASGQAQQPQPQAPAQPQRPSTPRPQARPQTQPQPDNSSGLPGDLDSVIDDILGGNTGAPQQPQQRPAQPQQPEVPGGIGDILGGILGGGGSSAPQQQPELPGGIGDILGGILGGGASAPQQRPSQQQPELPGGIGDILGGILGGGNTPQQRPSQQQPELPGGIGDILGGILGGGSSGGAGGMGIDPSIAGNPILAPIVNSISKKLGLPPAIVAIGLSLILNKLLSKAASAGQQRSAPRQSPSPSPSSSGLDLDEILGQMRAGNFDRRTIAQSGVVNDVAGETGLGQDDARTLTDEIIAALSAEGSARPMPKQSGSGAHGGLKDLLNEW